MTSQERLQIQLRELERLTALATGLADGLRDYAEAVRRLAEERVPDEEV